jgi:hypothetical protein
MYSWALKKAIIAIDSFLTLGTFLSLRQQEELANRAKGKTQIAVISLSSLL